MSLRRQDILASIGFVLPSILIILAVAFLPIAATFVLSFSETKISQLVPRDFVGLSNYLDYLGNRTFWQPAGRPPFFPFGGGGGEVLRGGGPPLLPPARPPLWRFLRISLILPWAVPTIVNGALWRWIYNADYGALNALLHQAGLIERYIPWLTRPLPAMNLIIGADIWHSVPFVALILQAALATIPNELEEAAAVDGANALQRFLFVRLPLLRSAILVVLVIRTVEAFRVFDIIYVITQGGPAFASETLNIYIFQTGFNYFHLGYASSLLIVLFVIVMSVSLILIRVRRADW